MENATSVLLVRGDGMVLAATRRGTIDQWGLIGGKQDPGETIEECAEREYFEEVGLKLSSAPTKIFERVCEGGADGREFNVSVFAVTNPIDIAVAVAKFTEPMEVEPGIIIGFVSVMEILRGPFGKFNRALLDRLNEISDEAAKPTACS